jgi:hypothetical protein
MTYRTGARVFIKVGKTNIRGIVAGDSKYRVPIKNSQTKFQLRREVLVNTKKGEYLVSPMRVKRRIF